MKGRKAKKKSSAAAKAVPVPVPSQHSRLSQLIASSCSVGPGFEESLHLPCETNKCGAGKVPISYHFEVFYFYPRFVCNLLPYLTNTIFVFPFHQCNRVTFEVFGFN